MTALSQIHDGALAPDPAAIERFLVLAGGDAIHLVAIPPDAGPVTGRWFGANAKAAARWAVAENAAGCNIYWSVNRVRDGLPKKATKADVTGARWAYVDVDPPKGEGLFDKAAVIAAFGSAPRQPNLIVDSGGGVQALWKLDGTASVREVEVINKALIQRFSGDPACWNIDRVLRVSGTVNWPSAKKRAAGRVTRSTKVIASAWSSRGPLQPKRKGLTTSASR